MHTMDQRAGSFLFGHEIRVAAPSIRFALACVLLAAAPTAAPCFGHWPQSQLLQAIPLPALPPQAAGTHPPDHLLRKLPAVLPGGRITETL